MKHLLLSALAIVALSTPALAEERQVEIAVSELTCPSCSFIVASSMRGVPSVESIIGAVTANGYPAQVLPDTAS